MGDDTLFGTGGKCWLVVNYRLPSAIEQKQSLIRHVEPRTLNDRGLSLPSGAVVKQLRADDDGVLGGLGRVYR